MDIDKLLKALDNEENSFLIDMTTEKIKKINENALSNLHLSKELLDDYKRKLKNYVYVDDMTDLKHGSFIRWIPLSNPDDLPLKQGGVFCELKINDNGVNLVCKGFGYKKSHYQIKFDENMIFRILSDQELVILQALDHLQMK